MIKISGNKVAIVPIENPDMIGSLYVPEIAKDRLNQGFVKYLGPDVKDLKVGAYVFFSGYTGTLTYIEREGKFIIMPEDFVIARLDNTEHMEIPGLFFVDRDGDTFPANYELAMEYIAAAFSENKEWRDRIQVTNKALKSSDLDVGAEASV